ncbi:MAG: EAL domain-containing protein [Kangiellaceae bacterium]|nr:EAL domain-containing protein [Kangiellaceae bacterium]
MTSRRNFGHISLKWKIGISVSLILIFINSLISVINYHSLNQQFVDQQSEQFVHQNRESTNQIQQVFQRLEDLVESLPLYDSASHRGDPIEHALHKNWGRLEFSHQLRTAQLLTLKNKTIGQWGESSNLPSKELVNQIAREPMPIKGFICSGDCNFYLASPVLAPSGDTNVLILTHSVADWLLSLKTASGADTGLLFVDNSRALGTKTKDTQIINDKRYLSNWHASVTGLTSFETNMDILQRLSNKTALDNASDTNNYLKKNGKVLNIQVIALQMQNIGDLVHLILINDVSDNRKQILSGVYRAVFIALLGVVVTGLFIVISLWRPMNHLSSLTEALTLLATGDFNKVKKVLSRDESFFIFTDEFDTLDDTTVGLTYQLEDLQKEVKERETELKKSALHDALTGLANRRYFTECIQQSISEISRTNEKFAVLFLDLDQFKRINDSLGHDQGDNLLIQVSERLKECIRESDIVARMGGDEFTILISHLKGASHATNIAIKILKRLRQPFTLGKQELIVTTSIGIAIAPDNGKESEILLRNADLAMYKAKGRGRDNYHYYTVSMNSEAQERIELENELRSAVENDEFVLYYQPQVELKTGMIIGLEALLRWNSPIRGLVPPVVFMSALEDTGLIVPLGVKILHIACNQLSEWNKQNNDRIKVAVNLSAKQFNDSNLVTHIETALNEANLESRFLELEITESMLMDDIDGTISTLHQLKNLGLQLSIDDFGTGYSSLSYLQKFPVDILKIDRAFVKDIPKNESDMAICSAVIAMAHKLNLAVVAEGIEKKKQANFLRNNNCEIGQGYYFGKPMPTKSVTSILRKSHSVAIELS